MCSWAGTYLFNKGLQDGVGFSVCSHQRRTHSSAWASAWTSACTKHDSPAPEMKTYEFHGSAWNLKPGPDAGSGWEDVVTQKPVHSVNGKFHSIRELMP